MELATEIWVYALTSVILVSLLSVIGIVFTSVSEAKLKQIVFVLVSLAVGSLFGDLLSTCCPRHLNEVV